MAHPPTPSGASAMLRRLSVAGLTILATVGATLAVTGPSATATVSVNQVYPVPSGGTYTVRGHGWGHGHGMSQYGALGAALKGLNAQQILAFYYPGTQRTIVADSRIRVLISSDTTDAVTVDPRSGLAVRDLGKDVTRTLPVRSDIGGWQLDTTTDNRNVVEWWDERADTWRVWRPRGWHLLAGEGEFFSPNGPVTLRTSAGRMPFRGALRAAAPSPTSSARDTVNVVNIDDYVKGVIPAEMPASWHKYAVRAQAVAARTYAIFERDANYERYYQVCDTTACQVYRGVSAEDPRSNDAAVATAGQIRTWNGEAAFTQFSSSNGGWSSAGSRPYLVSKEDPYDDTPANPNHDWSTKLSARTIRNAYPAIGSLLRVRVTRREGGGEWQGRAVTVVLEGTKAKRTISGDEFRWKFGLKSTWFRL